MRVILLYSNNTFKERPANRPELLDGHRREQLFNNTCGRYVALPYLALNTSIQNTSPLGHRPAHPKWGPHQHGYKRPCPPYPPRTV
jgi:hypothetical protein